MKAPFTVGQFMDVFKSYNESVFPMQIVFYLIALVAIYFAVKPDPASDKIISGILAFFWLWMGAVYHLAFFTSINNAAFLFAALFIAQGILFVLSGVIQHKLSFRLQNDVYGLTGIAFILFALVVYPVLGYFNGHIYPSSPTFGLPCPTTIFTFGFLLLSDKKIPFFIATIPVIWSLVGFTAAINFGIIEDTGLLIAGVFGFMLLLIKNKSSVKKISELLKSSDEHELQ